MEAVKGLQGFYHATEGVWAGTGSKLKTLCGTSISPNYRRFKSIKSVVSCPKCRLIVKGKIEQIKAEEKKVYLELNNLSEEDCLDLDRENIKFNIEYKLKELNLGR